VQFEFKILYEVKTLKAFQREVEEGAERLQVSISSAPLTSDNRTPDNRTSKLLKQQQSKDHGRLTTEQQIGSAEQSLVTRWQCTDTNCRNYNQWCYIDPRNKLHYDLFPSEMKRWSTLIGNGQGSVENPPETVLVSLLTNGPINRDSKRPGKKQADSRAQFQDMMGQLMEMKQMEMQGRMIDMLNTTGSSGNSAPHSGSPLVIQGGQPMYTLPQTSLPPFQQLPYGFSQSYGLPQPFPPLAPQGQHLATSQLQENTIQRPKSPPEVAPKLQSSPYSHSESESEDGFIKAFLDWKIDSIQDGSKRDRWAKAKSIVIDNDWCIADLRQMSEIDNPLYTVALRHGITDGIARNFKREMKAFRKQRAVTLSAAGVLAGGFLLS